MITVLIISIILNIILFQDARNYATKSIDKHREIIARLRIICEYIDLFIINNKDIIKKYKTLDWRKLEKFKTVTSRGLKYNSIVDLFFKDLQEEGYYELTDEQRKKLYMLSANTKTFSDEQIHDLAKVVISTYKKTKQAETQ